MTIKLILINFKRACGSFFGRGSKWR